MQPDFMSSFGFPSLASGAPDPMSTDLNPANTIQPPQGPPMPQQPQQPPQAPQYQAPNYLDVNGPHAAYQAAAARFAQMTGQAPPPMPQMQGPSANPWLALGLGLANFAANRENPRLMQGSQAAQQEMQGFQQQADRKNQNSQNAYQSQIQARNAGLSQAQLEAQNAGQEYQGVLGQNAAMREDALKKYQAELGPYGKLGAAMITGNSRDYAADQTLKGRLGAAQITGNVKKYVADTTAGDQQLSKMVQAAAAAPSEMRPTMYAAIQQYKPANGSVNPYANLDETAMAKTLDLNPKEQAELALTTQRNAHAGLYVSQYGLAPAKAAQLAQMTADMPGLDTAKIGQSYANANLLDAKRGDLGFKQQLASNQQVQKNYSDAILGMRDQLSTLSTQMNTLRSERKELEKEGTADSIARISAIDQSIGRMNGAYTELQQRSQGIQKALAPVDANGNVQGLKAPTPPPNNPRVPPPAHNQAFYDQQFVTQAKNWAPQKIQAFQQAYQQQFGKPPPAWNK